MKSAFSVALLAASAQASRWWPSATHSESGGTQCAHIAGVYQWTETVNEFSSGPFEAITMPELGDEANTCAGAVGLLQIHPSCTWFLKRIRNDPFLDVYVEDDAECASDNTGFRAEQLERSESEFWSFPKRVGKGFPEITFTVEKVLGFAGGAHRIQGLMEKENGCNLAFEGWRIKADADLTHCKKGRVNGIPVGFDLKRKAQLTDEDTSSVSVSDIKDALALIANNIPDWDQTSTGSEGSTSDSDRTGAGAGACQAIAGVYTVVLTNSEFDGSEVGSVPIAGSFIESNICSDMVGLIDIHESCDYAAKFIRPSENVGGADPHDVLCIDDAGGWDNNGVCAYENEFWMYTGSVTGPDSKFKVAIGELTGSARGPLFLSGIYELHGQDAVGTALPGDGCDFAVSGWRTARTQVTPCRDRPAFVAPGP